VPPQELPPSIRTFLSRYVRSIEQLEILLLLGTQPGVLWSASKVYEAILSTPSSVQRWLSELVSVGLLEKTSDAAASYRCSTDGDVRSQIALLAQIYRTSPVRVIETIYKREANAAQSFADAFKLKTPDQNS
jgi:hypothetical protein